MRQLGINTSIFLITLVVIVSITGCSKMVDVKYANEQVDLAGFEYIDTSKSSFVNGAWYDQNDMHMVIRLDEIYYQYCDLPVGIWNKFKEASSFGSYYNDEIKGGYGCDDKNGNNEIEDVGLIFDHIIPLGIGGSDFKANSDEYTLEELKTIPGYNDSYPACFNEAIQEESVILTKAGYERQSDGTWINPSEEYPKWYPEGELETEIEFSVSELFAECIDL